MMGDDDLVGKFWYCEEVTRKIRDECNRTINEEGANDITQLLILNEELRNLFKHKESLLWNGCQGIVHDRCLLDGLVFTEYFYKKNLVSKDVYEIACFYWSKYYDMYDIIFYPNPHDLELVDDGERSIDKDFRNSIILSYEYNYINKKPWSKKVITLNGTVEERMEHIKVILHEHGIR